MKKFSGRLVWESLKEAGKGFGDDKVAKLSASLAYYTVFSLGPLLIVIIYLASIFLGGQQSAQESVYGYIQQFMGPDAAKQIQEIIANANQSGKGGFAATIGVITLLIGATTVFGEIQDSINGIWGLKPKPKAGLMRLIMSRVLSFGMIASLGFLLLVSLGATAVVEAIGARLQNVFPDVTVVLFYIVNLLLNIAVTTALFAVIFKVLPDAKFKWKNIWPGAIATSLLFIIGKLLISLYISKSDIGGTYGAAGSLVILLVWVYYSAFILYFGAEFTRAYALKRGAKIVPDKFAVWDETKTIAGASPKTDTPKTGEHNRSTPEQSIPRGMVPAGGPQPSYEAHRFVHPIKEKKASPVGMGTVLIGLVLYLFRPANRRNSGS